MFAVMFKLKKYMTEMKNEFLNLSDDTQKTVETIMALVSAG